MQVLVTGAAGFIGSHVSEALLAAGHDVVGLDAFVPYYPRAVKEANLATALAHDSFRFVVADLRSDDLEPIVAGVDAVIHLAAMPGLPRSWVDVETYAACNLLATHRLLEACRAQPVQRFLQVSTSSVYGTNACGDETLPTKPVSPYGVTKLAAEHLVLAYVELFRFPASIVRYFAIFGPRQRPDMAYHIFIEAMLDGREITVFGDGEQSRSSTFVSDCVAGTLRALWDGLPGELYNLGGGELLTVNRAIQVIADATGVVPDVQHREARVGDQRHTAADITRARRQLGYEPLTSPEDGLRAQVDWHLARRS